MPLKTTPESLFVSRRRFFSKTKYLLAAGALSSPLCPAVFALSRGYLNDLTPLTTTLDPKYTLLEPTKFSSITSYNNYYEFSTDKKAVSILAQELEISPWSIECSGHIAHPQTLTIENLKDLGLISRTYRLRCVEGWSMIVPWDGIELNKLIALCAPKKEAKYIRFVGTLDPRAMIGQRRDTMPWPYTEGLRLDEANHPLTMLAVGLYGKTLPKQNGAPVRLVVPWKYGFKSIKAIKKIEFVEQKPETSWNQLAPQEYGFYANVNPLVSHPRWSQRREVPLGQLKKQKTLMYNGYESEVAHLYNGMDLEVHY